jgi:hypothetical protein
MVHRTFEVADNFPGATWAFLAVYWFNPSYTYSIELGDGSPLPPESILVLRAAPMFLGKA